MANVDRPFIDRMVLEGRRDVPVEVNDLARSLSMIVETVDRERGEVIAGFLTGPQHCHGLSIVQGGVIATMLDYAMAYAVIACSEAERGPVTLNMSVDYLAALSPGRCRAVGRVQKLGSRTAFASATLTDAAGKRVAEARSVAAIVGGY